MTDDERREAVLGLGNEELVDLFAGLVMQAAKASGALQVAADASANIAQAEILRRIRGRVSDQPATIP